MTVPWLYLGSVSVVFDNGLIIAGSVRKGDNVCMRLYYQPEIELNINR